MINYTHICFCFLTLFYAWPEKSLAILKKYDNGYKEMFQYFGKCIKYV